MIQKRILTAVAIPLIAGVARLVASRLRRKGRMTAADRMDHLVDLVSPQKSKKKRRGLRRR